MNDSDARDTLRREITRILQQQAASGERRDARPTTIAKAVACSSMAVLALGPVSSFAVGLDELRLNSGLGQPLRATVPLRLAAGETLNPNCLRSGGAPGSELRAPADVRLRVPAATGPGVFDVELTSARPLYEPMYELALTIDCPGMPVVIRQYVLMLDLPVMQGAVRAPETARRPVARQSLQPPQRPPNRSRAAARLARSSDPIVPGSVYRVREGDTLSTIAARVQGRPANFTWPLARLIFNANPEAFIRGNPDLVKLGARLRIPEPSAWNAAAAPAVAPAANVADSAPAARLVPSSTPLPTPAPLETRPAAAAPIAALENSIPPMPAQAPDIAAAQTSPGASPFADDYRSAEPATPDASMPATASSIAARDATGPEVAAEPSSTISDAAPPPPVVMKPERSTGTLNPLVATLFGMLIGLGLSVLMLRGRLLEGALTLLQRRRPGQQATATPAADQTFDSTDDWIPATDTQIDSLPVREADETYVVEIEAADETSETFNPVLAGAPAEAGPAVATTRDLQVGEDSGDVVGEVALPELFDDDLADLPSEPDLPAEVFMSGDEADAADSEAVALGPTEELPHFHDSEAEMTAAIGDSDDTAELAELDDESFDTAGMTLEQLAEQGLSAEDTRLSQTLRDALSLLERDYEDELTASQIIDQDALKNALDQKEGSG